MSSQPLDQKPTISDFLRASGRLIDRAEEQDVPLRRRDGPDLVVTTVERMALMAQTIELLARATIEMVEDQPARVAEAIKVALPWTGALAEDERVRLARDVARAAAVAVTIGDHEGLRAAMSRWKRVGFARSADAAPRRADERPVSIPDDIDDPTREEPSGVVELPLHVRWSGPSRTYDLSDPSQLRLVYEQVLQEGTDDDVRRFINVGTLLDHWDALVLPRRVREAWARWLRDRRDANV